MKKNNLWQRIVENKHFYFFVAPFFMTFIVFMLFPVLYSFYISLSSWTGLTSDFIGLRNYEILIHDDVFWKSLGNTVYLWLGNVPLIVIGSLILAVILNNKDVRFLGVFRTGYFLPFVTSTVVVGIVFSLLLDQHYGVVNYLLELIGLNKIPFLTNTLWAKPAIILLLVWRWVGYNTIIMLAGLQNIDPNLYEAAEIDGAGTIKKFTRITVPLMSPIILFVTILSTIGSFKIFAEPYILTNGGPLRSTLTIVMFLYNKGFEQFRMGYASAISYVLFAIILVLSLIQLKIGSRKEGL